MKIKYAVAALAATTMMAGAALADSNDKKRRNQVKSIAIRIARLQPA